MASSTVPDAPVSRGRRVAQAAAAGMVATVLFVTVFTVEGWVRPGYSPAGMFVSELSLGPRGWVQILNFVLTGALLWVFGRGLAAHFRLGAASRAGPVLVQIIAVALMASGPFTTDPTAMFTRTSAQGIIHGVLGAVVFSLAPITCFVFYRRFRHDRSWRPLAGWTLAAGIVLTLGIGVLKVSQQPGTGLFPLKGLVQRAVLVTFMAWLFTVAARLHHNGRRSHPGADAATVHGAGLTGKRWSSSSSRGGDQVQKTVMAAATPLAIRHLVRGVPLVQPCSNVLPPGGSGSRAPAAT